MSDEPDHIKRRSAATIDSLRKAEQVAEALDLPFDGASTVELAHTLQKMYHHDVCKALDICPERIQFRHGILSSMEAFVVPFRQRPTIYFDELLDFWLWDLNFLLTFSSCYEFDGEENAELSRMVISRLTWKHGPEAQHLLARDEIWPIGLRYPQVLLASHALTMTQVAFIICHEVAHAELDHLNQPYYPQMEVEADELAFKFLLQVFGERNNLSFLKLDDSTYGAPALALNYLSEMASVTEGISEAHSLELGFQERVKHLANRTRHCWPRSSIEKFDGLMIECKRLSRETPQVS